MFVQGETCSQKRTKSLGEVREPCKSTAHEGLLKEARIKKIYGGCKNVKQKERGAKNISGQLSGAKRKGNRGGEEQVLVLLWL